LKALNFILTFNFSIMKTGKLLLSLLVFLLLQSWQCSGTGQQKKDFESPVIIIETEFGNIKLVLYNQTPLHRDNMLKLIEEGFYENLLFHRVIQNFMIQGGDPASKNAVQGERLGSGGTEYTLPAEIVPELFHKKGALAAARMGDNVNPARRSSGSQFYIVQGSVFTDEQLTETEKRINNARLQNLFYRFIAEERERAFEKDEAVNQAELVKIAEGRAMEAFAAQELYQFTENQRHIYKTIGGAAHLDAAYTVFGEVTEGIEVIDKIAAQPVDAANRPVKDIRMKIKIANK